MENKKNQKATRDGYGEGIVEAGKKNKNVVALCADLTNSMRLNKFKQKFPNRFIECGVAEQNMMGLAAGLALAGKIPFVSSFGVFSPAINWSQLRVVVGQNNANVKVVGSHAGVSVGEDGMSHQALEDIALTRCLPGMVVLAPCDALEAKKATLAAAEHQGPVYLRLTRPKTPVISSQNTNFKIGKANILKKGEDVTVIGSGPILNNCLQAADKLKKQGIKVEVINNHTIKPLDAKTIINSARKTKKVITVEDHQVMGGMGSAIAELLSQRYPVLIKMIAIQDQWGQSGKGEELIERYGLGVNSIVQEIEKIINKG